MLIKAGCRLPLAQQNILMFTIKLLHNAKKKNGIRKIQWHVVLKLHSCKINEKQYFSEGFPATVCTWEYGGAPWSYLVFLAETWRQGDTPSSQNPTGVGVPWVGRGRGKPGLHQTQTLQRRRGCGLLPTEDGQCPDGSQECFTLN